MILNRHEFQVLYAVVPLVPVFVVDVFGRFEFSIQMFRHNFSVLGRLSPRNTDLAVSAACHHALVEAGLAAKSVPRFRGFELSPALFAVFRRHYSLLLVKSWLPSPWALERVCQA